jgi:hypothetical protein
VLTAFCQIALMFGPHHDWGDDLIRKDNIDEAGQILLPSVFRE